MIIAKNPNFVFVAVPKTGTTSIEKVFKRRKWNPLKPRPKITIIEGSNKHQKISDLSPEHYFKDEGFTSFGFVRNPWARLVSAYYQVKKPLYLENPKRKELYDWANDSFSTFVDGMIDSGRVLSQSSFFYDTEGAKNVDFIGFFEDLSFSANRLAGFYELGAIRLSVENSRGRTASYKSYYDDRLLALLEREFQWEIETLGYSFDDPIPSAVDAFLPEENESYRDEKYALRANDSLNVSS